MQALLRMETLISKIGYSRPWIYKEIKAERFPKPIKIGRTSAWVEKEIAEWIALKIEAGRAV